MANTTNFGWETPDDTDLVKDGASAMRTLGNAIDTSLVDLKGGTTGQVLSKASNTDMDFTWSSVDPLTILDAKGDLISATAADTPARLASSGVNGDVLQVDTSTATGLKWAAPSSGSLTLLSTTTLSGTTTTISSISSAYTNLYFLVYGMTNATGASNLRVNLGGNATFFRMDSTPGTNQLLDGLLTLNASGTTILNTGGLNAWQMTIYNYASTSTYKPFMGSGFYQVSGPASYSNFFGGGISTTNAISSLAFSIQSGATFNGGTVLVYGVK